MKKTILVAMLLLFTVGLTACRNDSTDYDESDQNYEHDGALYGQEEANTESDEHRSNDSNQRPDNPEISLEQAILIAYEDLEERGITATFRSDSGMEWERGQWVWELLFASEGENMPFVEYYISVDDGSIAKFEWDD